MREREQMYIIELDDQDFPYLADTLQGGTRVGTIFREGEVCTVVASKKLVMTGSSANPNSISIKPARNFNEAIRLALDLLSEEEKNGSMVSIDFDAG